jgi:ADP-ribose pyrophosphatase
VPTDSTQPPVEFLAEGRFLQLLRRGRWEYAHRHTASGAVGIIAVTPAGELLLTEQFRVPHGRRVVELPAGIVGDEADVQDDSVLKAAERELLEETGYAADAFEVVTEGPTSAGLSTEVVTLVRARGLRRVAAGGGVAHEAIEVHGVPLAGAASWLAAKRAAGVGVDSKVYAALYFCGLAG